MQQVTVGSSSLQVSRLAYGCWRIATSGDDSVDLQKARDSIRAAKEAGFTLFDLADIYCDGRSEVIFGRVLQMEPTLRQGMVLATKCGIRFAGEPTADAPYRYDMSAEHIIRSCETSLKRLGVETIDIYQLHRPDWLMDPAEVAGAFSKLRQDGKVREFGVSNFTPSQTATLQEACDRALVVNQVEISLLQLAAFQDGTLDQCLSRKIMPLAWSPLGGGMLGEGATSILPAQESYRPAAVVGELDRISLAKGTSRTAVALAWLLKHPAGIVPIIGSTQPERIRTAAAAADVALTREEWYRLLVAARGEQLP